MPLGVREVLLIIRAKDQASRALMEVGTQIAGLEGAALSMNRTNLQSAAAWGGIAAGAIVAAGAGIFAFAKISEAAVEYNRQSALTLTQVDDLVVGLEDIKR